MGNFIDGYTEGMVMVFKIFLSMVCLILLLICATTSSTMFCYLFPESSIVDLILFLWEFLNFIMIEIYVVSGISVIIFTSYFTRKLCTNKRKSKSQNENTKEVKNKNGKTNTK